MVLLAQVADLAARLNVDPDGLTTQQQLQWETLLEDASEAIRDVIGSPLDFRTSTITMWVGDLPVVGRAQMRPQVNNRFDTRALVYSQLIRLPAVPAVELISITDEFGPIDGELLDSHTLRVWTANTLVTITYTHGWAVIPRELVRWTCVLAASMLQASKTGNLGMAGGISSVGIDDGRVAFAASQPGQAIDLPDTVRVRLRATYGPSMLEAHER